MGNVSLFVDVIGAWWNRIKKKLLPCRKRDSARRILLHCFELMKEVFAK